MSHLISPERTTVVPGGSKDPELTATYIPKVGATEAWVVSDVMPGLDQEVVSHRVGGPAFCGWRSRPAGRPVGEGDHISHSPSFGEDLPRLLLIGRDSR